MPYSPKYARSRIQHHLDLGRQPDWTQAMPLGITMPHCADIVQSFLNYSHPQVLHTVMTSLLTEPNTAVQVQAIPPTSRKPWSFELRMVSSDQRTDLFAPGYFDREEEQPTQRTEGPAAGEPGPEGSGWHSDDVDHIGGFLEDEEGLHDF